MATFDAQIRQFAEKAGENIDETIRGTLLDLTARVIRRTPVGDPTYWQDPPSPGYVGGTARGNWQASIGQPIQSEIPRVDPNGSFTIADAQNTIENAPGNVYWLTNNVPYILRLEYEGWSRQAPAGMVRVTMSELDESIRDNASRVNR